MLRSGQKITGFILSLIFLVIHLKRLKVSFREIKQNLNIKFEYIHLTFPTINIPYQSRALTTIHEPTVTHHITPNLWLTLGFFLVHFMDLTSNLFIVFYKSSSCSD